MSSVPPVSVSNIDAAEILAAIGKLETDLAKMKVALGATGVVVPKARKSAKAAPAADGEKKAPNAWIVFTQKVDGALKAASIATGAATVGKQFASSLKDIKPYAEWTDEAIVAAWPTWEKPAPKPKAAAASSASESEEGASAAAAPKKERKKRAPMTAEAKAAAKLKRDAKKAAAAGGAVTASASEESEEEDAPSQPPAPPAAAPPAPAEPPVKAFAKKVVGAAKPAFTLEQLADFTPTDIDGAENGVNCRGDVVDGDGNYLGHWNSKTKVLSRGGAPPADWQAILDTMNA
jgi:hypothetical protein